MKISEGIYMLEITGQIMEKKNVVNLTVLYDNNSLVLVDTGNPTQMPKIKQAFEYDKIPFDKLSTIILTHQDIDHVGSISDIINDRNGQVQVFAHKEEEPYINGEKKPIKLAELENNLKYLPEKAQIIYKGIKAGFENNRVKIDKTLADGEKLPYLSGVTVIYTPGHTPGHISLYLEKEKILIAGDILMVNEGKLVTAADRINYDSKLNMKSLKKLMNYDIKTVVCYHGGIYKDDVNKRIAELCNAEGK